MIRANLRVSVPNMSSSTSLVNAVGPDNMKMAGLKIVGRAKPRIAEFRITFDGRIETFIFTLDDLLQCLQAPKRILDSLARENTES